MSTSVAKSPPIKTVGLWVVKIAFALMFLAAAGAKLAGSDMMVHEFDLVGLGQWFRYFTAAIEIAGALAMLWPATAALGAAILALVCVGAFLAQVFAIHMDWIHAVVMALALGAIAWAEARRKHVLF